MAVLQELFEKGQAGFTVYSPDCTQSRLWGNLDHAIHDATGFQAVYRQWINHDVNTISRFYNSDNEPVIEQDPEEYERKFEQIPVADLKYGHLVMKLFLSGPCLLTIWQGENAVIPTLLNLKGRTQPAQASPESIRGRFWCDNGVCNLLHVSDDLAEAERELKSIHLSLDFEGTPLPLFEPIPAPTSYVAHSGIAVVCDVVNRLLAGERETIVIQLPPSGNAKETNQILTQILREAAQRSPKVAPMIDAFLRGDVVAITEVMKKMPVTKWEHFIIQCGTITRDQWNVLSVK